MSTIETPPQDRLPVETIVAPYDERLIRDAIRRELNRGGQVFYLHNRDSGHRGRRRAPARVGARRPASPSATARCTATNWRRS